MEPSPRKPDIELLLDDKPIPAVAGEAVAVSLWAADERLLGRSIKYHRARGAFCFTGDCASCLMRIGGEPNQLACQVAARPGLEVRRQNAFPSAKLDLLAAVDWMFPRGLDHNRLLARAPEEVHGVMQRAVRQLSGLGMLPDAPLEMRPSVEELSCDLLVVGGGAAGLAASAAAASAGRARGRPLRVLLIEREGQAGGRLRADPEPLPSPGPAGARTGPELARALLAEARAAGVEVRLGTAAVGFYPEEQRLLAAGPDRVSRIGFGRLLLATGAAPRVDPFEGCDLPGVISAVGAGRMLLGHGVVAGRRFATVGTDPLGLRVAAALERAGAAWVGRFPDAAAIKRARGIRRLRGLVTDGGRKLDCDTLLACQRPAPATELCRQAGALVELRIAEGGFCVRTGDWGPPGQVAPEVFATGDVLGVDDDVQRRLDRAAEVGRAAAAPALEGTR